MQGDAGMAVALAEAAQVSAGAGRRDSRNSSAGYQQSVEGDNAFAARAQLDISLSLPSATVMRFERIPAVVTLKNNTGTLLSNLTGLTVNVYDPSTGALVVRKTGLSSSATGTSPGVAVAGCFGSR